MHIVQDECKTNNINLCWWYYCLYKSNFIRPLHSFRRFKSIKVIWFSTSFQCLHSCDQESTNKLESNFFYNSDIELWTPWMLQMIAKLHWWFENDWQKCFFKIFLMPLLELFHLMLFLNNMKNHVKRKNVCLKKRHNLICSTNMNNYQRKYLVHSLISHNRQSFDIK